MAANVPSRLYRSRSQKMLGGVCGGLGEYFDVDPVLIRLLFVVTSFISGAGILAYIILWIVVPFEGDESPRLDTLKRDFDDLTGRVREYMDPPRPGAPGGASGSAGGSSPDVSGYHGFSSSTDPAGGSPPAASPFDPGKDAPMSSDTTTARVPITENPSAAEARPEAASGPATASDAPGAAATAETPLEIDPPMGPPPGTPPPGTPPFGTPAGSAPGASPFGSAAGTPPYGAPPAGPRPGGPTWASPGAPPPFGSTPFGAPAAAPTDRKKRRQHWAGAILILLGLLILGNNLGLLWWVRAEYVLPLVLVGAGAWLLFGRGRRG